MGKGMRFGPSQRHGKGRCLGSAGDWLGVMAGAMEFIGTLQFFNQNGKRGNPLALYLDRLDNGECRISIRLPQWHELVGVGATPNKAAGDFEIKLKSAYPLPGAYDGPAWNGIKAEKPAPPKPPSGADPKVHSPAASQAAAAASATTSAVPGPTSPAAEAPGVPTENGSMKPA